MNSYRIDGCNVELVRGIYIYNGSLAIKAYESGSCQLYAVLTVCLSDRPSKDCAFVDVNNVKSVERFLTENNIAKPTGRSARSGYCIYPEYRFNKEFLDMCRVD